VGTLSNTDPFATPAPSLMDLEASLAPPVRLSAAAAHVTRAFATLVVARAQNLLDLDDEEVYPHVDVAGMVCINSEVLNALLAAHVMAQTGNRVR
jgi:hypothetical protein